MFEWTSPTKRVVMMAPDVQLTELDAGGIEEPRADWTQSAQDFIASDVTNRLAGTGAELVSAENLTPHEIQLAKLDSVVGQTILLHLYVSPLKLPNKGDALDWTLGPGANDLRDRFNADYALFVFVRDSYSSGGRKALQVLGALAGVAIPGGIQVAFASLVDLRTGNIVWFNRIVSGNGDLRTAGPAQKTVDTLLEGLPI